MVPRSAKGKKIVGQFTKFHEIVSSKESSLDGLDDISEPFHRLAVRPRSHIQNFEETRGFQTFVLVWFCYEATAEPILLLNFTTFCSACSAKLNPDCIPNLQRQFLACKTNCGVLRTTLKDDLLSQEPFGLIRMSRHIVVSLVGRKELIYRM